MVLAYSGKTEIVWQTVSPAVIDKVSDELDFIKSVYHGVSFFHHDTVFHNLRYEDAAFYDALAEKFTLSEAHEGKAELAFLNRPRSSNLASGYITEDHQRALVVGEGFGLFKSAVSGFASLQVEPAGYVPAHAAALSLNGKGILFAGGSRGGKTTALFNVAIQAHLQGVDVKILCDDWLIVRPSDGRLVASTFDPSISLTLSDLDRAISLDRIDKSDLLERLKTRSKISVPPSFVFGPQVQTREISIDAIVIINPSAGLDKLEPCGSGGIADFLISSAYHFPYVSDQLRDRHRKFWTAWADRVPVHEYSYLGKLGFGPSIARLVDSLLSSQ